MDERITQHAEIELRDPVLIAAFRGWNDAGEAASFAASHLGRVWSATELASIDPEDFYDFQSVRPQVELVDGTSRKITWPANEFSAVRLPQANHDVILLVGTEPSTKWRTFSSLIVDIARLHGVKLVMTLGALLADVAHSRPVQITGTAVDRELIERLNLQRSRYEGPTGIVGVLHEAFSQAQIDSASLWAAVPHYLAVTPNPKAALALVERTTHLLGVPAEIDDLVRATSVYEERVTEMVSGDDEVQAYVRMLEERTDEQQDLEEMDSSQMPSGEDIAEELERFLRDKGQGG